MLLLLVVLLMYTAVVLNKAVRFRESVTTFHRFNKEQAKQAAKPTAVEISTDVATWQSYTNTKYGLSFSYPGVWQPKVYSLDKDYDVIELSSSTNQNPVKIYISAKDYFGMAGLATKKTTVGGKPAVNFKDMLVGVKVDKLYFTFDIGNGSPNLVAVFKKVLASVTFSKVTLK